MDGPSMNFYQHHIGDFNNATRHLTRVERALYRDLIELYYDTEKPLITDFEALARRILARDEQEKAALKVVLDEFFTLEFDGYHNNRCDAEIAKYHANVESKSRAGRASALARKHNSTHIEHMLDECLTNQEPLTINQEPRTINHKPDETISSDCSKRFDVFWNIYPKKVGKEAARKSFLKMVKNQTVFDGVLNALDWQTKSDQWLKEGGQFIPNPATYLNQGRWQDEPESKKQNKSGGFDEKDYGETGLL
jgi:uncharacterized protein YdaU (DUF1376 family)